MVSQLLLPAYDGVGADGGAAESGDHRIAGDPDRESTVTCDGAGP